MILESLQNRKQRTLDLHGMLRATPAFLTLMCLMTSVIRGGRISSTCAFSLEEGSFSSSVNRLLFVMVLFNHFYSASKFFVYANELF